MREKNQQDKRRNTCFEYDFERGDYTRIAALAGVCHTSVTKTLKYGTRHNQKVIEAAKKYYEAKQALKAQFKQAS